MYHTSMPYGLHLTSRNIRTQKDGHFFGFVFVLLIRITEYLKCL